MEAGYLIGMIVLVVVCWYIGEPLLFNRSIKAGAVDADGKVRQDLALRKEEIMLTLKDLEMDFKMKKVSAEDYQALYNEALHQGSRLVRQIEAIKTVPKKLEITPPDTSKPPLKFCTLCGTELTAGGRFCGGCGRQI